MLIVRFPNGQAVQYNLATVIVRAEHCMLLYTDETKSRWIANVPYDCIVESGINGIGRVYNPLQQTGDMLGWLLDHLRGLSSRSERDKLAQLKLALKDFNAQRRTWK